MAKLIFLCGWALSGKGALAEMLHKLLGAHWVDIDSIRWITTGQPYPYPNESEELMRRDQQEMGNAYDILFQVIAWHLANNRDLIATATLSRKVQCQDRLKAVYDRYPGTAVSIVQCVPHNDTPEVVAQMLQRRALHGGHKGAVNSPERYFEVKNRFNPIELPHLKVPTWGGGLTVEAEAASVLEYLTNNRS